MRDAAVGFQCPECVKEGARSTRQAKGAYGGSRALDARATTFTLIGLNALVWIAILATGGYSGVLYRSLALLPATSVAGNGHVIQGVSGGSWWMLLTVAFVHVQIWHIAVNMLSLYFIGPPIEQVLGRARFLAVYLGSALVASAAVMWLGPAHGFTEGASGAIFGLLGAFGVVVYKVGGDVRQVLVWIGINLAFTFFSGLRISWQGHVGGLVGGALLAAIIVYAPRKNREALQWVGIAVVVVAALAASVVRAVTL